MKRHPVRLPRADPSSEHQHELFPKELFHPSAAELAASPNRVQVLLGEQTTLMDQARIHVSNARGYLRSPPRRLHMIQAGFSPQISEGAAALSPATADVTTNGQRRRPLPPIQTSPAPPTANNTAYDEPIKSTEHATSERIRQLFDRYVQEQSGHLSRSDAFQAIFGEESMTGSAPHHPLQTSIGDSSALSSISSPSGAFAPEVLVSKCMAHVPRMVAKNILVPEGADTQQEDGADNTIESGGGRAFPANHQLPSFVPWEGQAALLFVDISGYSKVTAALAPFGPYALSDAVNGYLVQMIGVIVDQYGGDVVKFAGDAILVAWTPQEDLTGGDPPPSTTPNGPSKSGALRLSCLRAVACATTLQKHYSRYPVSLPHRAKQTNHDSTTGGAASVQDGASKPLEFSIHVGISVGTIETAVFHFPSARFTENLFHSLTGPALRSVGLAADMAASGQVCLTSAVVDLLTEAPGPDNNQTTVPLRSVECGAAPTAHSQKGASAMHLLQSFDTATADAMISAADRDPFHNDEALLRDVCRHFIPPVLLQRFSSTATNVAAEMRFLAVLFISKTDPDASIADWFYEVHQVLDAHRCAVVKLIDDDKGVHVIAAVGLFLSEPDASMMAVDAAMHLADREAGCCVGVAAGLTFCGLIGSADLACRWDITGSACVRACRMMQRAAEIRPSGECFVDISVLETISNRAAINEYGERLIIKGAAEPVKVFVLAPKSGHPAWLVPNTIPASLFSTLCHVEARQLLVNLLTDGEGPLRRSGSTSSAVHARRKSETLLGDQAPAFFHHTAIVITGPFGVGKRTLAATAAGECGFTMIQHKCAASPVAVSIGGGDLLLPAAGPTTAPLAIAETLSRWFVHHPLKSLQELAVNIHAAHAAGHVGKTRRLLLSLIYAAATVEGGSTPIKTMLVIENAQYLDRASLEFVRHLLRQRRSVPKEEAANTGCFACVLCVTPMMGALSAAQLLSNVCAPMEHEGVAVRDHVAASSMLLTLEPVAAATVRDLASKYFSWDVDESLFRLLLAQCSGLPLFVAHYVRHVMAQRPYVTRVHKWKRSMLLYVVCFLGLGRSTKVYVMCHVGTTMSLQGVVHLSQEARAKAESWEWMEIAPSIAPELLQQYDAATAAPHRAILRALACLQGAPCDDPSAQDDGSVLTDLLEHVTWKVLRDGSKASHKQFTLWVKQLAGVHLVATAAAPHCPLLSQNCSSKVIRLASVALKNVLYRSITPDYALRILRMAKAFLLNQAAERSKEAAGGVCEGFAALRLAQYSYHELKLMERLASRPQVVSPSATPKLQPHTQQTPVDFDAVAKIASQVQSMERYCSGVHCGGATPSSSSTDIPAKLSAASEMLLRVLDGDVQQQEAEVVAPSSSLHFTTISLDVVAVKNYAPPIGLGTATASVVLELCRWMRNVYVSFANGTPVSDKTAAMAKTLARRFATCLKSVARVLHGVQPPHPMLSDDHSASLSPKSIGRLESEITTTCSDMFLSVVRDPSTATTAAAEACKQLLQFFSTRLVPCALAFQEVVPDILHTLTPPPEGVLQATAAAAPALSQLFSLWHSVQLYQAASPPPTSTSGGGIGGGDDSDAPAGGCSLPTFHAAFMALATSNFMPNNPRVSLAWIRNRVLHERVESARSFRSCVVGDYLCAVAATASLLPQQDRKTA